MPYTPFACALAALDRYATCVVRIDGARHNDMADGGSDQLKARIVSAIATFLNPVPNPRYASERDSTLD